MAYLKSVENVITLDKLIGLLFLFCLPLLSVLILKTPNGNHFSSIYCIYSYILKDQKSKIPIFESFFCNIDVS